MAYLAQKEVLALLRQYSIPAVPSHFYRTVKSASFHAPKHGYPLVMKVESSDIIHKTDAGGVITGIGNEKDGARAYERMMKQVRRKHPKAKIRGICLQRQVHGKEIIIGMKRDPVFGPVILFGAGGIFVEVLKDVSFRIAPISTREAKKMIDETRIATLLYGVRGERPVAIKKVQEMLANASIMATKETRIIEMDLNPVIVNEKEAYVVDARVMAE